MKRWSIYRFHFKQRSKIVFFLNWIFFFVGLSKAFFFSVVDSDNFAPVPGSGFQNSGSGSCSSFFVIFIPFKIVTRYFTRRTYNIRIEYCLITVLLKKKVLFNFDFLMILVDVLLLRIWIRMPKSPGSTGSGADLQHWSSL